MRTKSRVIGGNGVTANKRVTKTATKKSATKQPTTKTNYTKVDKNIYYTGKSYRVRVGKESKYCSNITEAKNWKKVLLGDYKWDNGKAVKV